MLYKEGLNLLGFLVGEDFKSTIVENVTVLVNLNNIFEVTGVVNSINFRPDGLEFVIADAAGDSRVSFTICKRNHFPTH